MVRYFEWMGAACYTADQRSGAMHGKQFRWMRCCRDRRGVRVRAIGFAGKVPIDAFEVVVNVESWANHAGNPRRELRLDATGGRRAHHVVEGDNRVRHRRCRLDGCERCAGALVRNFEFGLPLSGCWRLR